MQQEIRYQELDASKIITTIESIARRIDERFPGSGLHAVSLKLLQVSQRATQQAEWINKPILALRVATGVLILMIIAALFATLMNMTNPTQSIKLLDFIQILESGINDLVLIGIGIYFLVSAEARFKRHRALKAIHELRAIAHIIDMHQLSKDPDRMRWEISGDLKPTQNLTPLQLNRYLEYCTEMLSLVGKVCVLYVQKFDDPIALAAVNEVENLTTGLTRKIWQKMMISHRGLD